MPTRATSRNSHVEADPEKYRARKTPEQIKALEDGGFTFKDYEGMMSEMRKGDLVIDDISHHEMEKLIEIYKPDIIGSGIKDKFVVEKMGLPCKQLHSYDYGGPYAAFTGAANFYQEVDRMVNTKVWKYATPPWEKNPQLRASLVSRPKGAARKEEEAPKQSRVETHPARFSGSQTLTSHQSQITSHQNHVGLHTRRNSASRGASHQPAKTCQPIGAMYASLGIHGCMPHSHGSQGCCAYHRSHLTRHFKEPVVATTSSFTEGASVFGGLANLTQALTNIFTIYNPEIVAVHTTCLSEVIGDDIPMIIKKCTEQGIIPAGKTVIHANTPSFVGSHITGFSNMTVAMVKYLAEKTGEPKDQVNLVPGFVDPSDMRELKRLAAEMGVKVVMFPDTSDVLDLPQRRLSDVSQGRRDHRPAPQHG